MRDDIRQLTEQAGCADFPYVEVRSAERSRRAASRWPLLVSTNRMLGVGGSEPDTPAPGKIRSTDQQFAAPAPDDPQTRELEGALPLLVSTRRFATASRST